MIGRVWFFPQLRCLVLAVALVFTPADFSEVGQTRAKAAEFNNPNLIAILIHNTVLALNQANLTGNYTVLRDLGSPDFRRATTAADLAVIFQEQRKIKLDTSAVVVFRPRLSRPAEITNSGHLHIVGFYPTKPLQVNFDLTFQIISGKWRIFRIIVVPSTPEKTTNMKSKTQSMTVKKSSKGAKSSKIITPKKKPKRTNN